MTDNAAILTGYTLQIDADNGQGLALSLLVRPGFDPDGTFRAWDMDAQEFISVNGWLFSSETIEDRAAT